MDSSTLQLHRGLARLAKGMLKLYSTWIDQQSEDRLLAQLKAKQAELTKDPIEDCDERK